MFNPLLFSNITLINNINLEKIYINHNDYNHILCGTWNNSRTGRNYIILKNKYTNQEFWLTSKRALNNSFLTVNPFYPKIHEKVEKYLIKNTGFINEAEYYWSHFIDSTTLEFASEEYIFDFLTDFYHVQNENSFTSNDYVDCFIQLVKSKETNKNIINKILKIKKDYFGNVIKKCSCSFSHGDLWPKDVFSSGIIIDWEWFVDCAPLGIDCIDFIFSYYKLENKPRKIKKFLLNNSNNIVKYFLNNRDKRIIIKFFIFRFLVRDIIQYNFTLSSYKWFDFLYKIGKSIN